MVRTSSTHAEVFFSLRVHARTVYNDLAVAAELDVVAEPTANMAVVTLEVLASTRLKRNCRILGLCCWRSHKRSSHLFNASNFFSMPIILWAHLVQIDVEDHAAHTSRDI